MKNLVKTVLARFGFKLQRLDTPLRSFGQGVELLAQYIDLSTVIDIGVGRGTPELYTAFKGKNFVLIEADPANSEYLAAVAAPIKARTVRVFCGASSGEVTFYSAKRGTQFSTAYKLNVGLDTTEMRLPVLPLDSIIREPGPFLIKIDVEGAEMDVLRGATEILKDTVAVIAETSIAPRYEGTAELADIVGYMYERGFSVFDILLGSNLQGKLFQVDLVFVRTDAHFRQLKKEQTV